MLPSGWARLRRCLHAVGALLLRLATGRRRGRGRGAALRLRLLPSAFYLRPFLRLVIVVGHALRCWTRSTVSAAVPRHERY